MILRKTFFGRPRQYFVNCRGGACLTAYNLIAGDAVEQPVGRKAQAARFTELSHPVWRENSRSQYREA
jgi:hypothetical protein